MALPFDPKREEAVAIAALLTTVVKVPGTIGHCANCKIHIWINPTTSAFMAKHEVPAICPPCAVKFSKGE